MPDTTGEYTDIKAWVEGKLGEQLPLDLWEWSHDGKRLCRLANILRAGTVDIKMLNKRSGPMFHMQNIDFATEGYKKLLPKKYGGRIFRSPDLYEKKSSYPKGIWICLDALKSEDGKGKFGGGGGAAASTSVKKAAALPTPLANDIAKTKLKYAKATAVEETSTLKRAGSGLGASSKAISSSFSKENTTGGYEEVKQWVESKLGEELSDDLWEWSHDGKRLCKLANVLMPGACDMKMLNKRSGAFFHMQNIDFATAGFKTMLPKKYQARLFRSPDLYEKLSSYPKGIWICIDALMKLDQSGKLKRV